MIGVTSILSSFMHLSLPVALCACPEEPEPLRPAACVRLHVQRPVRGELPALRAEPGPEPRTLPMKTWWCGRYNEGNRCPVAPKSQSGEAGLPGRNDHRRQCRFIALASQLSGLGYHRPGGVTAWQSIQRPMTASTLARVQ